jgi:hypothetical protein
MDFIANLGKRKLLNDGEKGNFREVEDHLVLSYLMNVEIVTLLNGTDLFNIQVPTQKNLVMNV